MKAPTIRSFDAQSFDPAALGDAKGSTTVSVCIPARNEEATVGQIVTTIRERLVEGAGLVDEIVVVDDHSDDDTSGVAADAGAVVVKAAETLPGHARGHGKGLALWKSLFASRGDVVVWCDADVRDFDPCFVTGLVGPLLTEPDLSFVKGYYQRPVDGHVRGGGRVTELVARPLLMFLFPQLANVVQPLSGEYAGRREVLEQLPFVEGYGVDIALLIDVATWYGVAALAQVDLGQRIHRNRSLDELSPMAAEVMQAALRRAAPGLVPERAVLVPPELEPLEIVYRERPPLATLPEYRERPSR